MKTVPVKVAVMCVGISLAMNALSASATELNRQQYASQFSLYPMDSAYGKSVATCLQAWGDKHPFKDRAQIKFRVIQTNVKVLGVGNNINDTAKTDYPQIILVKPGVNVMSEMSMDLMNPNGWYCLSARVNVMGRSTINLACETHLASTTGSVTVFGHRRGEDDADDTGTTVMGETVINRKCNKPVAI